jgi:hypothetical protein
VYKRVILKLRFFIPEQSAANLAKKLGKKTMDGKYLVFPFNKKKICWVKN